MKDLNVTIQRNLNGTNKNMYSANYILAGRQTHVEWESEVDLTEKEFIDIIKQTYDSER